MKASKHPCASCGKLAECYDTRLFVVAQERFQPGFYCARCLAAVYAEAGKAQKARKGEK